MSNRTVLITGGASGIGRACARVFLDNEWVVYATDIDTEGLEDLQAEGCRTDRLDVTADADVERVVGRIDGEMGRLDCLVNNAAFGQFGPLEDVPVERLHEQFDVNVYGPHRLTRAVLPLMRDREDGTIVNVSSFYGRVASPGSGAYAGSKHALEGMSDALRAEVDPFGVDVVLIEPGLVDTAFLDRMAPAVDALPRTPAYDDLYETIDDLTVAARSMPFASTPAEAATVIHDAAAVSDPDARYTVGPSGRFLVATRFLPDRVRDGLYRLFRRLT